MASLFESLQKRLAQSPAPAAPQQQSVQKVLAAKGGKARGNTAPAASNVGEQVAIDQASAAGKQQTLLGRVAGAQLTQDAANQAQQTKTAKTQLATQKTTAENALATQAQGAREQLTATEDLANTQRAGNAELAINDINARADRQLAALASERGVTLDNLFSNFERSNTELEFRKDAAELEKRAFTLAMADKDYLAEIDRIGRERQLTNDINFRQEMSEIVLGKNLSSFLDNLGFKQKMDAKTRDWEIQLQNMGAGIKVDMAIQMLKDQGRQQIFTGAGNLASAIGTDLVKDDSTIAEWFKSSDTTSSDVPVATSAPTFNYGPLSTFTPKEGQR